MALIFVTDLEEILSKKLGVPLLCIVILSVSKSRSMRKTPQVITLLLQPQGDVWS